MIRMKKDERERIQEAIAERNASWFMMLILVVGILIKIVISLYTTNTISIDPILLVAILGGAIVKFISFKYS